ncbi:MAG: phage tail tip lysozyme [Anaerocolumna sp.]
MAATPAWPVLQTGSSGKNVSALQCLLTFQGYSLTIDGSFGPNTQTAVINFQRSRGLTTDGVAGVNTLSALIVTIQNGSNNYAARAAQYLLSKFETITVDGIFGANSTTVAKNFQQKMGISADSIIGPTTWKFLFSYSVYPSTGNGSTYCNNSYLTQSQMAVNAQYILDYFRVKGWTKNAVCGMLGNMQTESTINPGIWQGLHENNMSGGFGLVQWTPATNYINWAQGSNLPVADMDSELKRILYEVSAGLQFYATSTYNMTFTQFTHSTESAYYLACVFLHNYERPANASQDQTRGNQATYWYNTLN